MTTNVLEEALAFGVSCENTRDHNKDDLEKLMLSYMVLEQARDSFLNQEITFDEYLQLCELHEVNVDSYRSTIEHNLVKLKLM